MKRVDLRSRRCHAFSQSRLDVEEARLSAFGSGQLANDEVTPSPGAAGYLIRFNADVVPAEEALLAIVVVHSSKIEPRLQPMTTRSRGACTDLAPCGSFQPRDGWRSGSLVKRRFHDFRGCLPPKSRDSPLSKHASCKVHICAYPFHRPYSQGNFGRTGSGSTTGCWK